jgi:three-Cys-motif partner protein
MTSDSFELLNLPDDGLITPSIKSHTLEKYKVISYFLNIFSRSMKAKWNNRVYIDLFAGAGKSKVEGENKIVPGSPLIALGVKDKFDKYIFCERDISLCDALNTRVSSICAKSKFKIICGDTNQNIESILKEIPEYKKGNTCLSVCLVDPRGINDLKFETIKNLSNIFIDFLVLIPTNMDARRNESIYVEPDEIIVDTFLGDQNWRIEWAEKKLSPNSDFGLFVLDYFGRKMRNLKYIYNGPEDTKPIYLKSKNLPLYHLAYFSRDKIGSEFWNDTKEYTNPQMGFNFKEI